MFANIRRLPIRAQATATFLTSWLRSGKDLYIEKANTSALEEGGRSDRGQQRAHHEWKERHRLDLEQFIPGTAMSFMVQR